MMDTMKGEVSTFTGTLMYMPPERFDKPNYDRSNDIWSLGVVIAECANSEYPFKNKMSEDHYYGVEDNYNKTRLQVLGTIIDEKFFQECFGEKYSKQLKYFTKICLSPFEERPKEARKLMELAFYKTHCESLEDEQQCSSNQLVNQPTNPTSDQNRTQENTAIPAPDQVESHDDNDQSNAPDKDTDQINTPLIGVPRQHLNRISIKKIIAIATIPLVICISTIILILIYRNKYHERQTSTSFMTSALPTTTTSSTAPTIKCPDGPKWIHYNNTNACYYVDQGTISWHTAKRKCRKLDPRSNLTSIICQAEDEFIQKIASIYPHSSKIAIGLHQDAIHSQNSYEWVDKTAINYTNWRTDPTIDTQEHCVFKEVFDGKWNWNIESSCTIEISIIYVCKIKLH
uniref:mitogen-activated protein kinase kinase n=1 Tax=Acrobeloides nanus TaxID=290746 RepID=A0A914EHF3_9BILA